MMVFFFVLVFFFKQKTAYEMRISDWSSDVCSSDLRIAPPVGDDAVEMAQAVQQNCRLDGIKPRHHAPFDDRIAIRQPVVAEPAQPFGQCLIAGGDEAGIAHGVQVLERMGRKGAGMPERAGMTVVETRTHGLGGGLDQDRKRTRLNSSPICAS